MLFISLDIRLCAYFNYIFCLKINFFISLLYLNRGIIVWDRHIVWIMIGN